MRASSHEGAGPCLGREADKLCEVKRRIESEHPSLSITLISADLSDPSAPERIAMQVAEADIQLYYGKQCRRLGPEIASGLRLAGPSGLSHAHDDEHYWAMSSPDASDDCSNRGRVINVASVAGRIASGGDSHYGLRLRHRFV